MKWEVQGQGVAAVESRVTDMKCLAALGRRVLGAAVMRRHRERCALPRQEPGFD